MSADAQVARLAMRQDGVVSRAQLIGLGIGPSAIDRRLRLGRLHRLHRGVYAVGHHRLGRRGVWRAALLRCGPEAVLGLRSAAQLWEIWRGGTVAPVEVIADSTPGRLPGLRRHRARLAADEVTRRDGLPVTTLARTVLDLSASLDQTGISGMLREAQFRHRLDPASVDRLSRRHRGHRGAADLVPCLVRLDAVAETATRSPLEDRFAAFLARHRLPRPERNAIIDLGDRRIEADCLFREPRLIVELDGREAHGTDAAFQGDRSRDRRLLAYGWRTVRVTHAHLDAPGPLLADLRLIFGTGES